MPDALDPHDFSQSRAAANVEEFFEVEFSESEVETIVTIGDLYDLLLKKFPPNEDNRKCAGAMAFYRLRRALSDKRPRKELSPSFELTSLDGISAQALFKDLEQATGLKLPPHDPARIGKIANWIGMIGCAMWVLGWIAALVAFVTLKILYGGAAGFLYGIAIGLGSVAIGVGAFSLMQFIDRYDPGVIPEDYRTLGSLARRAAWLNYAALAKSGAARTEKVIWQMFTELLSREIRHEGLHLAPSEIAREIRFFEKDGPAAD